MTEEEQQQQQAKSRGTLIVELRRELEASKKENTHLRSLVFPGVEIHDENGRVIEMQEVPNAEPPAKRQRAAEVAATRSFVELGVSYDARLVKVEQVSLPIC